MDRTGRRGGLPAAAIPHIERNESGGCRPCDIPRPPAEAAAVAAGGYLTSQAFVLSASIQQMSRQESQTLSPPV
jgi:hypothetical protein